jgi:membrane protease YdiL (CAAX protease family)
MRSDVPSTAAPETSGVWLGFPWTFFLAVFAVSVPLWVLGGLSSARLMPGLPLSALMFISTAFIACFYAANTGGTVAMRRLLARSLDVRRIGSALWLFPSLLLMPGVLAASYAIMQVAKLPLPVPAVPWSLAPALLLPFFLAAVAEELAWSATVLGPLQSRFGALPAALIIGVIWAAWHVVPLTQAHQSMSWVLGQSLSTVAFRVVLVWLYNNTGRSVFAVSVCHASFNLAWQLFPNRGSHYDPWIAGTVTGLVALIATFGWGAKTLSRRPFGSVIE